MCFTFAKSLYQEVLVARVGDTQQGVGSSHAAGYGTIFWSNLSNWMLYVPYL